MKWKNSDDAPEGDSALGLLRNVYQNKLMPLPVRIRCAVEALPYEHPKLPSRVQVTTDFGCRLDQAIAASDRAKVVNLKLIEHDAGEN